MKTKRMMMAVASAVMLWAAEGMATSPDIGSYHCKSEDFQDNLKNAKYIVVARLEKYLPENQGEYHVLMSLRGPVEAGTVFKHTVLRRDGDKELIGHNYILLGEQYTKDAASYIFHEYKCAGRYSAQKIDNGGRPALDPIIDYILDGGK